MDDQLRLTRQWVLVGGVCGILAMAVYFVTASGVLPIPFRVEYPVFWFFGPLLVVTAFGFYHFFRLEGPSVALELSRLFMVIAGALVCLMGTVQGVAREHFAAVERNWSEGASEAVLMGYRGANAIQSGADLAWDIFIFLAIALLGWVMLHQSVAWRGIGIFGTAIAILGLAFNLYTWRANPGTAGLIDVGPVAGLWLLVSASYLLFKSRSLGK